MAMMRWHLDRYDRLRSSTASRAAVVLSAGALLSAANAIVISQLLRSTSAQVPIAAIAVCALIALISTVLVVLTVVLACGVLVTIKDSHTLFSAADQLPTSPVFNGTDTVTHLQSFADFVACLDTQSDADDYRSAQVELWIGIQQHRYRYVRLRSAVRCLRYAAAVFLFALFGVVTISLLYRLG